MKRYTLEAYGLRTLDWFQGKVIDWNSAGTQYDVNGEKKQLQRSHFGFVCDASISSKNGEFVFIYQKLGTKGLLLKNGKLHREINRSYYQHSVYEYPAAFLTYKNRTYLVHCPIKYCQLDIEDAETGEIITNTTERNPHDVFHSRLEVSPDHTHILSKGWYWHPWDGVELFNVEDCILNPTLLDKYITPPEVDTEICSASFINTDEILLCSSNEDSWDEEDEGSIPPKHLGIWNIKTNEINNVVKIQGAYGNIFAIDHTKCWDMFEYPKIISLQTGEIIDAMEEVFSGKQASSIIHHLQDLPKIAYDREHKHIAIGHKDAIEILTL